MRASDGRRILLWKNTVDASVVVFCWKCDTLTHRQRPTGARFRIAAIASTGAHDSTLIGYARARS
jgi:hypothetical protein